MEREIRVLINIKIILMTESPLLKSGKLHSIAVGGHHVRRVAVDHIPLLGVDHAGADTVRQELLPGQVLHLDVLSGGLRDGSAHLVHVHPVAGQGDFLVLELFKIADDIELLDVASDELDMDLVSKGQLSPVFFGSALNNFGIELFLNYFLEMTSSPLPRMSDSGLIDTFSPDFSAFVFKIQANMNKAHRDRIAFMRICSGKFDADKEVYHVQGKKKLRLSQPQQLMAQERKVISEAYAGDIIGVFDPGIFSIGDTVCAPGKKFAFEGIPTFAPEHFAKVRQVDTMKRKQFIKGISQIAQEGAIQIFQEYNTGMEEIIVGVVGVLQFDVLKHRLLNEYGVEIRLETMPHEYIRWIANKEDFDTNKIIGTSDMKRIKDLKGNPLLLFVHEWAVQSVLDKNKGLELSEFGRW